jgi:hypothetical protein
MTIKRVQQAAAIRGIYFDGIKAFRNTMIGTAYEVFTPNGRGFIQADTLQGLYNAIMKFERITEV